MQQEGPLCWSGMTRASGRSRAGRGDRQATPAYPLVCGSGRGGVWSGCCPEEGRQHLGPRSSCGGGEGRSDSEGETGLGFCWVPRFQGVLRDKQGRMCRLAELALTDCGIALQLPWGSLGLASGASEPRNAVVL